MADANTPATGAPSAAPTTTEASQTSTAEPKVIAQEKANLEQVAADPNATKQEKVQAVKRLKALKIKVDGQEFEEKLPFEIPDDPASVDYMRRQLQMSKAASKRMGEKAQLEGEVRQFLEQLKRDPRKVLADPAFGVDLKKMAAQLIEEEIANAAKSPAQLAQEKLEKELSELKEQRSREKQDYEKREFERLQATEYERIDTLMTQALEKSDLPKSPYVVKKIADYMKLGLTEGYDVSPSDVLPLVREEILEDIRQMAQAMPLDTIEKLFGGDILTKIRKKNVAKAKSAPATKAADVGVQPAKKEEKPVVKKTIKEMFGV